MLVKYIRHMLSSQNKDVIIIVIILFIIRVSMLKTHTRVTLNISNLKDCIDRFRVINFIA